MRSFLLKCVSSIVLTAIVALCSRAVIAEEVSTFLISNQTTNLIEVTTTGEPSVFVDGLPGNTEGIAFDAAGDIYVVVNGEGARILKIDARTRTVVRNYPVGSELLFGLAIRNQKAYTVGPWTGGIRVVDLVSGDVSTLNNSNSGWAVAFGPDGMLYCANNGLVRINPETGVETRLDKWFYGPDTFWDIKFDVDGNMYVSDLYGRRIVKHAPGSDGIFGNFDDVRSNVVEVDYSHVAYGIEIVNSQLLFCTNYNLTAMNLTNGVASVNTNASMPVFWIARRPVPNDLRGSIQIENVSYVAKEGVTEAIVSLVRGGGSEGNVEVNFRTSNGSAKDGLDFLGTNEVISFSDGQVQKTIVIPIVNDGASEAVFWYGYDGYFEPTEYFTCHISNPTGGANLGTQIATTITIEDNDGQPNLLWRHQDGRLAVWELDGTNKVAKYLLNDGQPIDLIWRFAALGDMNQDGRTDLLWQRNDGVVAGWFMNGTNISGKFRLNGGAPIDWKLLNATDWNQDFDPDLLWQHPDGRIALWYMDQTNRVSSKLIYNGSPVTSSWRFAGAVDMRKKGVPAIIWSNTDGRLGAWVMDRTTNGFMRVENHLFDDSYLPDGQGWIHRGFSSFFHLPLIDSQLYQNVNRQIALLDFSVWPHQTLYLNNGNPVAPGWKLLGSYPRSN